jgi:type IV secretory pathway VirB10-like protein
MLQQLNELYDSKQSEIGRHNSNMRVGFSVTSFISTLSYENKLLGEHITLYSDYLSFYHSSQRKYFDMALYKINNFMREIEDEILTNHKKDAPVEEIIMEIESESEPEPEPPKLAEPEPPKATEPEPPKVEPPKATEPEPPKVAEPEPPKVVEPEQSNATEREQPEDEIKHEEVLNDEDFQVVSKGGKRGKKK